MFQKIRRPLEITLLLLNVRYDASRNFNQLAKRTATRKLRQIKNGSAEYRATSICGYNLVNYFDEKEHENTAEIHVQFIEIPRSITTSFFCSGEFQNASFNY